MLKNYPAAEAAARTALELAPTFHNLVVEDERVLFDIRSQLAFSIARRGQLKEAGEIIQPVIAFHRALATRNVDDLTQRLELSNALFVSSLTDSASRKARLAEAAAILDRFPAEMKYWKPTVRLRAEIAAEQQKPPERQVTAGSVRTRG